MFALHSRLIRSFLFVGIGIILLPSIASSQQQSPAKEIAITIDNLPATTSFGFADRQAINQDLLDALKTFEVSATGFVVGEAIEEQFDLLGSWLNAGHVLGTMTFSNQDLHDVEPGRFFEDARFVISGAGASGSSFKNPPASA